MTKEYRLIGYGTTDENGVAHMEYDATGTALDPEGYTGTGAGQLDICVSTDDEDHISESSFQSAPFTILDTWMVDNGVIGDCNDDDWYIQTGGLRTVESDGTVFTGDSDSLFAWINKHGTSHSSMIDVTEFSDDFMVELTVVEADSSARFSVYEAYPSAKRADIILSEGVYKITKIGNKFVAFKDDVLVIVTTSTLTTPVRMGVICSQGDSLKIRDFKAYAYDTETTDYYYYDKAVLGVYNNAATYNNFSSEITLTRQSDGTNVGFTSAGSNYPQLNISHPTDHKEGVIEFDILNKGTGVKIQTAATHEDNTITYHSLNLQQDHYTITMTPTKLIMTRDGATIPLVIDNTSNPVKAYESMWTFTKNTSPDSFKYKELIVR